MKSFFIFMSRVKWMQRMIVKLPIARQMASRFTAGETLPEAIEAIRQLNHLGINASLDLLGENTTCLADASKATDEVLGILDGIYATQVASNVSIKLSQFGLGINTSACKDNLIRIFSRAKERDNFIRIDMEDSTLTSQTLEIYKWALERGYFNTGIVLQAYLYRSTGDLEDLATLKPRIRLCKGAYREPADLAFPRKRDVDQNYDKLTRRLLELSIQNNTPSLSENGRIPPIPAIATHDLARIKKAIDLVKSFHLPNKCLEFQMLYGIRRDLQVELARSGYPVRVYVPYGSHWYPYFMRRLAERPANVFFFVSQLFRK